MLKKKKAVLNLSLEIAFVKVLHVLNSFSITYPRTFLESRRALQPHKPCKYEVPETLGLKLLIQEMSTRRQHFSMPHPGSSGNQSPGEVFLACRLERSVPGLRSHMSSALPCTPQTPESPAWAACTFLLGLSLYCCRHNGGRADALAGWLCGLARTVYGTSWV